MNIQQPVLFVSHGAPTFALSPGRAGALLGALGRTLIKPSAIIVMSPHWMTPEVRIGAAMQPETIHDFSGFPDPLYSLQYRAPGAPELASKICTQLTSAGIAAALDAQVGRDHGAWVPLMHVFPAADIPVVQVSLPFSADADTALAIGRALAPLAIENVLIIGSGSLTHNLRNMRFHSSTVDSSASSFVAWIHDALHRGDTDAAAHALELAPNARASHPTSEHFLPLAFALGAAQTISPYTVIDGGIEHGAISMDSFVFGATLDLERSIETQ